MNFSVRGFGDGPRLRLDHRTYAYAGKFVMPSGKTLALAPDHTLPDAREGYAEGVIAVAATSEDRTDGQLWIRYLTTRTDRRGEGIGARLARFCAEQAHDAGYETVRIAVNNAYSYEACAKAGFGFTGRETGLAELVMEHPGDASRYDEGLALFAARDLSPDEQTFISRSRDRGPPALVPATPP